MSEPVPHSDSARIADANVAVSVVVPVFGNGGSLAELVARLTTVLAKVAVNHEILLIDDASPDDAWPRIRALSNDHASLRGLRHARNRGQHAAVLSGLAAARGNVCVVMDADLQDPPEAIPLLLERLHASRDDIVFAGRSGAYQETGRMLSSRLYRRWLLAPLTGLPADAGMFFAASRASVERLLALRTPSPPMLIGMVAAARLHCSSLPVSRELRRHGRSAYTGWRRVRAAWAMTRCALFSHFGEQQAPPHGAAVCERCGFEVGATA